LTGLFLLCPAVLFAQSPETFQQLDARVTEARYIVTILGGLLICYLIYSWRLRKAMTARSVELSAARQDLDSRGRALHALLDLGHSLTSARDTTSIAQNIVRQICKGTGFDRVGIYLIDGDQRVLRGVAGVNPQGEIEDCSRFVFSLESIDSPIVQVARGDREFYLTDSASTSLGGEPNVKHNAFVPLRAANEVLGVIAVDNLLSGRPFGEEEVAELRGFADEVALAFHNSHLLAQAEEHQSALEDRNRELSAIVGFGQASTTARSVDEVVRSIWTTVREGLGFDRVGIFLKEGDLIRGTIGTDEEGQLESTRDMSWPMASSAGNWRPLMLGEREYNYSSNFTEEEGVSTRSGKPIREHILVALRTGDSVIGAIAVDNFVTGRPIEEEDARPLVAFAQQAATALQSVMLLEALQSSEERLRVLVTSLTETLYSARVSGHSLVPLFYSPRVEELTGYSLEEALNDSDLWIGLVHPEDRDRYKNALSETMLGASSPIEYRIVHRNGDVRWVLDTPTPVRDDNGAVLRINGALLDITERKELEEGLRRAQKMETVGTLAGGIAHEFNNLLGIILGNVEFAQMDAGSDNPAQRSLEQTRKAVQRAADLTKQLLTFSAKIESRRTPIEIDCVVRETVQLLQSSLGKSVKIALEVEPKLEEVNADASQLQQVLINLCVNARDAMPSGGTITVGARPASVASDRAGKAPESPAGPYVVLTVSDTGSGMDASVQERIFEPFYTTKPVGRGTGLGLAVAYGIVTEHGGWMEVDSEPGRGTTFQVFLPTVSAAFAAAAEPEAQPPTALVIEASPSARSMLCDILEELGYSTLTAASASEALAIFWTDSDRVDLVVSDSRPAGMDVEQLIANFRDFKPDIPVLLGATVRNGVAPTFDGTGASVIRKPYDAEEIGRVAGMKGS
jgi:PAS domain S-box-containing protein